MRKMNPIPIIKPVVLVIDMQNDFCSDRGLLAKRGYFVGQMQKIVPNLLQFLSHVRAVGIPVAFIAAHYDRCYLTPTIAQRYKTAGLLGLCSEGTLGAELYGIKTDAGEPIFIKHRYDAFTSKAFSDWLATIRAKTLILTGCQTDVCVDSTARSGFMKGYSIVAIEDCLASLDIKSHKRALDFMKTYYNAHVRNSRVPFRKLGTTGDCHV